MSVLGVGGFFFRASDPETLSAWYREHLGIGAGLAAEDTGLPDKGSWKTQGGPLVFAPFERGTDYWASDKQYLLNLRVRDLESLLEKLTASGIEVIVRPEWDSPETGRFAPTILRAMRSSCGSRRRNDRPRPAWRLNRRILRSTLVSNRCST